MFNLSLEISLGIIFFFLTTALGIYTYLKPRTRNQLEFEQIEEFTLLEKRPISDDLSVSFKGKAIKSNLIFYRASIKNNSFSDIDESMTYESLKICLPEGVKYLTANLNKSDSSIKSNITLLSPESIEIKWDLLKKKEIITFEFLVELSDKIDLNKFDLFEKLHFKFRIKDIDKITKFSKKKEIKQYKKLNLYLMLGYALTIIVLASTEEIKNKISQFSSPLYELTNIQTQEKYYNSFIFNKNVNNSFTNNESFTIIEGDPISRTDFLSKYKIEKKGNSFWGDYSLFDWSKYLLIISRIMISICGLFLIIIYFKLFKTFKFFNSSK